MGWSLVERKKFAPVAAPCKISVSARNKLTVTFSGEALAVFEPKEGETSLNCTVLAGTGEDASKLRICRAPEGMFQANRFKSSFMIRGVLPAGVDLAATGGIKGQPVPWRRVSDFVVEITLPHTIKRRRT